MNQPDRRAQLSETLWRIAEQTIVAEWICCDPINPDHRLCSQGGAALAMVRALLVDDPKAWKPAPLLDAVLAVLGEQPDRAVVLREAAEKLHAQGQHLTGEFNDSDILHEDGPAATVATWKRAADLLRRLAVEAHSTGTQQPAAIALAAAQIREDADLREAEGETALAEYGRELASLLLGDPEEQATRCPHGCDVSRCPCLACEAADSAEEQQQPDTEAEPDDTVHACPGRWGGPDCRCFDDEPAPPSA